ncbi:unnamed protein product, partial [Brassica rapa subsp. narinosa]
ISILQHVSSKKKSFFFPFLPTRGFSSSFFVGVSSSCGLGGFSDYLLGFSIYLLTYTLIYAAHLCLELGVPSSADQRRHLPSSPTVFSYNVELINKCFATMKIYTIEISYSLSNPMDAFRYVVFLCSSRQLENRPLLKHSGGASSEVLGT